MLPAKQGKRQRGSPESGECESDECQDTEDGSEQPPSVARRHAGGCSFSVSSMSTCPPAFDWPTRQDSVREAEPSYPVRRTVQCPIGYTVAQDGQAETDTGRRKVWWGRGG